MSAHVHRAQTCLWVRVPCWVGLFLAASRPRPCAAPSYIRPRQPASQHRHTHPHPPKNQCAHAQDPMRTSYAVRSACVSLVALLPVYSVTRCRLADKRHTARQALKHDYFRQRPGELARRTFSCYADLARRARERHGTVRRVPPHLPPHLSFPLPAVAYRRRWDIGTPSDAGVPSS